MMMPVTLIMIVKVNIQLEKFTKCSKILTVINPTMKKLAIKAKSCWKLITIM